MLVGWLRSTPPGVTKAVALERWSSGRGIEVHDVWAFGDMPNDVPMIRWAGVGWAVANAHEEVRAVADRVCPSNDEDGVARTLERLLQHLDRAGPSHVPR